MQITSNTTQLRSELCVQTDKYGRDHCMVVLAGTFRADAAGELNLGSVQRPPTATDLHHGDPATSSVKYEADFALRKPLTDVSVVGKAVAPGGRPVHELRVALEVEGRSKELLVTGERRWARAGLGLVASKPVPFVEMPLTFERTFGGPGEPRNLVGVGAGGAEEGAALPNIEDPRDRVTSPRSRPAPVGFACVARSWQPRVSLAGTYDARWRDERCPFLPEDFDDRYFQCAPEDQQFPRFRGGERIRCVNMAERAVVEYRVPTRRVPVSFCFAAGRVERVAELDTIILEPHRSEAVLVWRASAPLTKRLVDLRAVEVGEQPTRERDEVIGHRRGKPVFPGIAATIRWLERRRGAA
jgi:hypothetical protein